jgi:hypothetical protein
MSDPRKQSLDLTVQNAETLARAAVRVPGLVGGLLSVVWVVAVGGYLYSGQSDGASMGVILTFFLVFLPLALIWSAIVTLRSVAELRAEAARLQASVDAMRNAYLTGGQGGGMKPSVERRIEEIAQSAKVTETAVSSFASRRDVNAVQPSADRKAAMITPAPQPPETEQPSLALGTPAEALRPPLSTVDFIRALQFPENPDDRDGFRALRAALEDRTVAKLVRASQDVLTLLSQEGIYMDDLRPDRTRPELWRRLAAGERGRTIGALGGVRDRSSLALTSGRMKEDEVFRDAALHFLRTFDRTFAEFEKNASDSDLIDLAETRTVRCFMLLGRVTGMFD